MPELSGISLALAMRPAFGFTDLGLAEPVADQPSQRWIQLVPIGSWEHSQYGQLDITPERIQCMAANYAAGLPGVDLPVDLDHAWGEAVGWIQSVEARDDGLWGLIEFNARGMELLSDRAYRYISPEWFPDWKDERTGEHYENVLTSVALTNRPWFKELPAIVTSEDERGRTYLVPAYRFRWEEKPKEFWYRVRDPGDFRADTMRSKDMPGVEGVRMILGRLKKDKVPKDHDPDALVLQSLRFDREQFSLDEAKTWVAEHREKLKASAPADDIARAIRGTEGETSMPDLKDPKTDDDPKLAPPAVTATEVKVMTERITGLETRNTELERKLALGDLRVLLGGMRFGDDKQRVLAPAMIEQLAETALRFTGGEERDQFLKGLEGLTFVELGERGADGGEPTGDAIQRFSEAVAAKTKADPQLGYAEAMRLVAAENPTLAEERERAIHGVQPLTRGQAKA